MQQHKVPDEFKSAGFVVKLYSLEAVVETMNHPLFHTGKLLQFLSAVVKKEMKRERISRRRLKKQRNGETFACSSSNFSFQNFILTSRNYLVLRIFLKLLRNYLK